MSAVNAYGIPSRVRARLAEPERREEREAKRALYEENPTEAWQTVKRALVSEEYLGGLENFEAIKRSILNDTAGVAFAAAFAWSMYGGKKVSTQVNDILSSPTMQLMIAEIRRVSEQPANPTRTQNDFLVSTAIEWKQMRYTVSNSHGPGELRDAIAGLDEYYRSVAESRRQQGAPLTWNHREKTCNDIMAAMFCIVRGVEPGQGLVNRDRSLNLSMLEDYREIEKRGTSIEFLESAVPDLAAYKAVRMRTHPDRPTPYIYSSFDFPYGPAEAEAKHLRGQDIWVGARHHAPAASAGSAASFFS